MLSIMNAMFILGDNNVMMTIILLELSLDHVNVSIGLDC